MIEKFGTGYYDLEEKTDEAFRLILNIRGMKEDSS